MALIVRIALATTLLAVASCASQEPARLATEAQDSAPTTEAAPEDTVAEPVSESTAAPKSAPVETGRVESGGLEDGGIEVDPAAYVPAEAVEQLAQFKQPVLMPSRVPGWAAQAKQHTWADPSNSIYWSSWFIDYGADPRTISLDSGLQIQLYVDDLSDADEPFAETSLRRATDVRTYVLGDSVASKDCGEASPDGPDGVAATWDEEGRRYSVVMIPSAGCAEEFTIDAALAFADSLVACTSDGRTLSCG